MSTTADPNRIEIALDGLHFAECLRWRDGLLYFSDMYGDSVHSFDPGTGELSVVGEIFHPGGIGWLPDGTMLVVASEDRRIMRVDAAGNAPYADLSEVAPGWANDLLVDATGRAYVGNFGYDLFAGEQRSTRLIRVDRDGAIDVEPGELLFPNGMVKRSDGALIVAETFGHRLAVFSIGDDGHVEPAGSIALESDSTPDGICIDAEDGIWVASALTGEVLRVDAGGRVSARHSFSQNPYACMLGGEDRRTLFVATAPDHEPAGRRARTEGRIEALRVEVPGVGPDGLGG
ncbi:MAG TPA: SMP-30/gluconolactonase/LRE family protein [Solirubrobacterales bacterium]|nr:SMP-30/gluconolactonase/LRE family protein [Solirubrobacterales bacterium]